MATAATGGNERDTLLRVIHELYHNQDKQVKKQAENWFGEFQKSPRSWESILGVLQDSNCPTEARHLCALALRNKCLQDLEELPREAAWTVRDAIIALVLVEPQLAVRTQLCLAFSGIAAHVPMQEWSGVGPVSWIEQRMSGEAKPVSLARTVEILCILAEEHGSYKPAVHPNRRRQYCKELESYSAKAFQVLMVAAQEPALLNDGKSLKYLLQAISSWLNLGGPDKMKESCADFSLQLHQHPLVTLSVKCLESTDMDVFDMAVDVMCSLVNCTLSDNGEILPEASGLVNLLMTSAMSLKPRFSQYILDSKAGKDVIEMEDIVKSIARFLVEISEAYLYYIAKGQADSLVMLEAMLEVVAHQDNDVYSMTFGFWYRLSKILTVGVDPDTELEIFLSSDHSPVTLFHPAFSKLVCSLREHVMLGADVESWSEGDHKDFRKVRYAISDTLTDAKQILGAETTLNLLLEPLHHHHTECSAGKPFDWKLAEGAYYCAKSLSRSMPFDSPLVYHLLSAIPTLPRQPQLLYTTCSTAGAYSSWIAGAMRKGKLPDTSLLATLLSFISSALYDANAAPAAAVAFKHVCDSCCDYLVAFTDQLFSVYNAVISEQSKVSPNSNQMNLGAEDVIEVLEGILFVVDKQESFEKKQASIQSILQQIMQPLQPMLNGSAAPEDAKALLLLEQLETRFKNIKDKQLVMQLLDYISSILDRALEVLGSNVECAEKVCGALKYGLKTSGTSTAQSLLQHLFTNIPLRFSRYSHPCLLYLSSELVKIFGGQAESHAWLHSLVSGLVCEAHTKLIEIKDFDNRPDIVDDLFLLAGRILSYAPAIVFAEEGVQTLQHLFNCAVAGMFINHRDALVSIYSFFYRLLACADDSVHSNSSRVLHTVIIPNGLILTKKLLAGITGSVAKAFLEDLAECLFKLLCAVPPAVSWVHESLHCIPPTALSPQEKQTFLEASQRVVAAAGNARSSMRVFVRQVQELSDVCRRSAAHRISTQNSLLTGV